MNTIRDAVGQRICPGEHVAHVTRQGSTVSITRRYVEHVNDDGTIRLEALEEGGRQGRVAAHNCVVTAQ